jgi:hypothetical protein
MFDIISELGTAFVNIRLIEKHGVAEGDRRCPNAILAL